MLDLHAASLGPAGLHQNTSADYEGPLSKGRGTEATLAAGSIWSDGRLG